MNTESYTLGAELDSFNYQEVQDGIQAILDKGCNAVLDMRACHYISSTGLRVLLYSKKMAATKGLQFCIVGIGEEVKDIMNVTGFCNFFEFFASMEECMAKMNSGE